MNLIDRIVGYVSPLAGVRRTQARMALDIAARGYDAGKVGRRTSNWRTGSGSANAEVLPSLERVRNRCRDVVRNNEYASMAIDSLVADTVGTGLTAKAPDQTLWNDWCDYCDADAQLDFNGLLELAQRTRRESGEVIIRFRSRLPEDGLAVPLQIQVLEPDHLDSHKTGPVGNGNHAIAGVEFDLIGRRVAYWLFPVHPGEVATFRLHTLQSVRVPASEVLHYYRKRRPTQVRGMPELAVSLMRMRDLADYEQAELVRKKIEACFVAFVRTDDASARLGETSNRGDGPRGAVQEKVAPGMIKYISGAEGVEFGAPSSGGGYGEYTRTQLYAIAAGAGVMYAAMTGDYSQANFSSQRGATLAYRGLIGQEQWLALAPMVLKPIARRFQQTAILAGKQSTRVTPFVWTMPKLQWLDPLKDVMASKEAVRGGLKSLSEVIREQGDDPDKTLAEIAKERTAAKNMGIVLDTDAAVSERLLDSAAVAKILNS